MKSPLAYVGVVALVAVIVTTLDRAFGVDPTERPLEIFTEMVYSKAVESFGQSEYLPGGMAQQHLVPGVVPRGTLAPRFGPGTEEAERAGRELFSPLSAEDPQVVERGGELFKVYCVICHDAGGNGNGRAVQRGMLPPPSLHGARATGMADGQMFHILSKGQGNMASYAVQLSVEERWQVIHYVRSLQEEGAR